jgi:hypothetical protein
LIEIKDECAAADMLCSPAGATAAREVSMAQSSAQTAERPRSGARAPSEIAAGAKNVEAVANAQRQMFGDLGVFGQEWFDRIAVEANLTTELAEKLVTARSAPDAAAAWQQWITQRALLLAEDNQRLIAESRKLADDVAGFMSAGWLGASR